VEKIFAVVEVLEEEKVNIKIFYLAEEIDIWWNTMKDKWQRLEFTWAKLLEELREKFEG